MVMLFCCQIWWLFKTIFVCVCVCFNQYKVSVQIISCRIITKVSIMAWDELILRVCSPIRRVPPKVKQKPYSMLSDRAMMDENVSVYWGNLIFLCINWTGISCISCPYMVHKWWHHLVQTINDSPLLKFLGNNMTYWDLFIMWPLINIHEDPMCVDSLSGANMEPQRCFGSFQQPLDHSLVTLLLLALYKDTCLSHAHISHTKATTDKKRSEIATLNSNMLWSVKMPNDDQDKGGCLSYHFGISEQNVYNLANLFCFFVFIIKFKEKWFHDYG